MKSPDTLVEMENTGSVEIVFSSLLDESSYMQDHLSLALRGSSVTALVLPFYPFTKEYT